MTVELSFLSAVALAGIAYMIGELVVRFIPALPRFYIPEPVVGGIIAAFGILFLRIGGNEVTVPTSGRPVDFLVALLTTQMGLHVTPEVLRKGVRLFPLFFGMGVLLYALQLALMFPVALTSDHPLASATLWGPVSFLGAPFNLNPPDQIEPIRRYLEPAYPDAKDLGQGIMMMGVLAAVVLPGILGRRIMSLVDQPPPKPAPSRQSIPKSVWSIATDEAAIMILVLSIVALAFPLQAWILDTVAWMKPGFLPVIVIAYLSGAVFRLGYEVAMGERIPFPQLPLNTLVLGPTMAIVLTYAIMSVPLYNLRLVTPPMVLAACLAIGASVAMARIAFPLFARVANHYAAGAAALVFLGITTGWGPMAMSYLRRFQDEEGQPELVPAVLPLHAFFLFPWMTSVLTILVNKVAG